MYSTRVHTRASVSANVRAEVARRGASQALIGQTLGLTQQAVSRRIRGDVEWTASELANLADLLELPVDALLGTRAGAPR